LLTALLLLFCLHPRPPPEFSPLSLHDALPISAAGAARQGSPQGSDPAEARGTARTGTRAAEAARAGEDAPAAEGSARRGTSEARSEEHTSELQSLTNLVCRLLLEKNKTYNDVP